MILNTALRADITFLLMVYRIWIDRSDGVVIKLQREKISFDFNALIAIIEYSRDTLLLNG